MLTGVRILTLHRQKKGVSMSDLKMITEGIKQLGGDYVMSIK
jgi:hypothetical protein